MFCVAVGAFVSVILEPYVTFTDAGGFAVNAVCSPLIFTMALVSTAMNATVNREKLIKIIKKLMLINEEIKNLEGFRREKKVNRCRSLTYVALACLVLHISVLCNALLPPIQWQRTCS